MDKLKKQNKTVALKNCTPPPPPQEEMDRKEKVTAGLNQTVRDLQHLLQSVNRQLTKRHEGVGLSCLHTGDGFISAPPL